MKVFFGLKKMFAKHSAMFSEKIDFEDKFKKN
jgi:hypothetical protein